MHLSCLILYITKYYFFLQNIILYITIQHEFNFCCKSAICLNSFDQDCLKNFILANSGVNRFKFKFDRSFIQQKMLFYLSRLKFLHFCYFEGLKMDILQLQYFQFTKTGFSPFKNLKNVIRSEIVESCYFCEKIKKQPLKTFWWLRNQGFTNSQTIPVINT